jgi:hypothetical protein
MLGIGAPETGGLIILPHLGNYYLEARRAPSE